MKLIKEEIVKSNSKLFNYLPNPDKDDAIAQWNYRVHARLETIDYILNLIPKFTDIDLLKNSNDTLDRVNKHIEKYGEVPDWHEGVITICKSVVDDANWYVGNSKNLLQQFFEHKSDANKISVSRTARGFRK